MPDPRIAEATRIYKEAHPEQTVEPNASGLAAMFAKGATPQQAADWFWYVVTHAEFPDGTAYGSAYGMQLDKNPGENTGFGYGLPAEEWHKTYTVAFAEGETPEMRAKASKPGLTWEQSLEIDPFLDFAYAQKMAAHKEGTASYAAERITALEASVDTLKVAVAKLTNG